MCGRDVWAGCVGEKSKKWRFQREWQKILSHEFFKVSHDQNKKM